MMASDFHKEMVERNIGVISAEEQSRLKNACVAVAGCGGMGGFSAEQLVRLGVGHVKIADHDSFAVHNLSRQCRSSTNNIGRNKAEVLAEYFKEINPDLKLEVYKEGVVPETAEKFMDGAEIVIDGTDFSNFKNSLLVYKTARDRNLCVLCPNAIGFGVNVFVFGPKTMSMEEYLGPMASINPLVKLQKFVPYIPKYADLSIVKDAAFGILNIPNLVMPQYLGTSIAVSEAIMLLLGRIKPPEGPNPRVFIFDLQDRKFEITG